jgi:hypothetical protein
MEGVQHAVADEPVGARRVELRIGSIAIERAVELARQLALDSEVRRVAFKGIGARLLRLSFMVSACGIDSSIAYLYIVKIT